MPCVWHDFRSAGGGGDFGAHGHRQCEKFKAIRSYVIVGSFRDCRNRDAARRCQSIVFGDSDGMLFEVGLLVALIFVKATTAPENDQV